MTITSNIASLIARQSTEQATQLLTRSQARLSSGLRLNTAADDPAALSLSEQLTSRISSLTQSNRNVSDGVSYLQVGEGALQDVTNSLQRIRELAVQAANATNSQQDRNFLQQEVSQRIAEVTRVLDDTNFNGNKLFDSQAVDRTFAGGDTANEQQQIIELLQRSLLEQSEQLIQTYFGLAASNANLEIILEDDIEGASAFVTGTATNVELHIDVNEAINVGLGYPNDTLDNLIAHEMVHAVMLATTNLFSFDRWFSEGTAEFLPGGDLRVDVLDGPGLNGQTISSDDIVNNIDNIRTSFGGSNLDYATAYTAVRYLHDISGGDGVRDVLGYLSADPTRTLDDYFTNIQPAGITSVDDFVTDFRANGAAFIDANIDLADSIADIGGIGGNDADGGTRDTSFSNTVPDIDNPTTDPLFGFNETFPDPLQVVEQTGSSLVFQVGANAGDYITITGSGLTSESIGIADLDVSLDAEAVITAIDAVLDRVNAERSNFGALIGRFDTHRITQETIIENDASTRSRIRDADFAAETANLSRASILQQAGVAIIGQANALPEFALALLN